MIARKRPQKSPRKGKVIDSSAEFEKLLERRDEHFVFRLYVTGHTVRSSQAIANIRSLCDEFLAGRYKLEVIDIYQQPGSVAKDQILAAPTLIKQLPAPVGRLIGDLSNRDKLLIALDLKHDSEELKSDTNDG
jgi:circadian clock protein KaiB